MSRPCELSVRWLRPLPHLAFLCDLALWSLLSLAYAALGFCGYCMHGLVISYSDLHNLSRRCFSRGTFMLFYSYVPAGALIRFLSTLLVAGRMEVLAALQLEFVIA